ncbi:MAG: hypothetical protein H8E44_16055 [Planctomycetes bacterium]|nr:hypothetical protein [Planctomycetota bacterium]
MMHVNYGQHRLRPGIIKRRVTVGEKTKVAELRKGDAQEVISIRDDARIWRPKLRQRIELLDRLTLVTKSGPPYFSG